MASSSLPLSWLPGWAVVWTRQRSRPSAKPAERWKGGADEGGIGGSVSLLEVAAWSGVTAVGWGGGVTAEDVLVVRGYPVG